MMEVIEYLGVKLFLSDRIETNIKWGLYQNEFWKDVAGYEGSYQVSSLGRIKSLPRTNVCTTKFLTRSPNVRDRYIYCALSKKGKPQKLKVHRMVAEAFIPNPENKKFVDHIAGNKNDNRLCALRWVTFQENIDFAWQTGIYNSIGSNHPQAKLTEGKVREIKKLQIQGVTGRQIADMYGVNFSTISDIKQGRCWGHINI